MVETGWGEDTLKLEPDLPPGEGPAEGSSGEPTDVFQEAWRAAPATQMARLCGQGGGYPAQHAPPLPGPRRPGAGERERRESLQTMPIPFIVLLRVEEEHFEKTVRLPFLLF